MFKTLRKPLITAALVAALVATPAQAIFGLGDIVFDPANYGQNILTAIRTLTMIRNQIVQLKNDASMLVNQTKNLQKLNISSALDLQYSLSQLQQIAAGADHMAFKVAATQTKWTQLYEGNYTGASTRQLLSDQTKRLDNSQEAFRQSLLLGAQVMEDTDAGAVTLDDLMQASKGASGALEVSQAGNELLSLAIKQQAGMQVVMAAHYRAKDLEAARRLAERRAATERRMSFMGDANAYSAG